MTASLIVLWGGRKNAELRRVASALQEIGAPTVFVAQDEDDEVDFDLAIESEIVGSLCIAGRVVRIEQISAIFVRPEARQTCGLGVEMESSVDAHPVDDLMISLCELSSALVVNRPEPMSTNASKPFQSELIRRSGFLVPDTLMTTEPEVVLDFWRAHGQLIYKSMSGTKSIVSRLTAEHAQRLDAICCCPTQFQQYIPGVEFRVHVVGSETFTTRIVSKADDYRNASTDDLRLEVACLPDEIDHHCRELVARMSLVVAGLDLRCAPNGNWYCLEVNPCPAFTFYEDATERSIGRAIAKLLARSLLRP